MRGRIRRRDQPNTITFLAMMLLATLIRTPISLVKPLCRPLLSTSALGFHPIHHSRIRVTSRHRICGSKRTTCRSTAAGLHTSSSSAAGAASSSSSSEIIDGGGTQEIFPTCFEYDTPLGHCVGLRLPKITSEEALPDLSALVGWELHPEELQLASSIPNPGVRVAFVGGRVALRRALRNLPMPPSATQAVLRDAAGAPTLPVNFQASISHKTDIAVCMVRSRDTVQAHIGVDVEACLPKKKNIDITPRVLTENERGQLGSLEEVGVSPESEVLLRFSFKESIYKAVHPFVKRYVGFKEAEVQPLKDGSCQVTLLLKNGEGPFEANGYWRKIDGDRFFLTAIALEEKEGGADALQP